MKSRHIFELGRWLRKYPLSPAYRWDCSDDGPENICRVEQFRRRVLKRYSVWNPVPTDVFVMKFGEPSRPNVTKYGGMPYRPRGVAWPISSHRKKPQYFVAQFNFTRSRDLVPKLPGDILLAFFPDFAAYPFDEMFPEPPHFEWYPARVKDRMTASEIPYGNDSWVPVCHGYRHRTADYIEGGRFVDELLSLRKPAPFRVGEARKHASDVRQLRAMLRARYVQLDMLKIAGIPYFRDPERGIVLGNAGWRFLCSIPSFSGSFELIEGWDDVPERTPRQTLYWSSGGVVHLYLTPEGNVAPWFEPYEIDW